MDLTGPWLAAEADDELRRRLPDDDLDDEDWQPIPVPGQWRLSPAFAETEGPLLYRHRFERPRPPAGADGAEGAGAGAPWTRSWLVFDGIFYQSDVWLDGSYLGDTEGYFAPHALEVTDQLAARREHLLAVEVACAPQRDHRRKHNLTGIFQDSDFLDHSWNPGGIWAPVHVVDTGPVRLRSLRVACREATPERATLDLDARLDARSPCAVTLRATVSGDDGPVGEAVRQDQLAAGDNRVRFRVTVERPALWWPHALGGQPLYGLEVTVDADGRQSDARHLTTGLRQLRMHQFVLTVNGERLFLKGANLAPTDRALSAVTADDVARDLTLARDAGLDLLRLRGHLGHPLLYDHADRAGLLLWQDLPLHRGYGPVRRQAVRQARAAVNLLGHHPSVAVWCAHDEPVGVDVPPGGRPASGEVARFVAGQLLPTRNKTLLDPRIRRALERTDGSRPVVSHSGVLPHPAWGTDTHAYYGWYHGEMRQLPTALARWPAVARFVSEFGAQSVPASDEFLHPERWPALDWDGLAAAHALQNDVFDRRVPPADHPSFDAWRKATQWYQAELVRFHVETLRRLKYRPTGGFCVSMLADAQPAVSWSLLDHRRVPKSAWAALIAACAPVIVVADWPDDSYAAGQHVDLAVHAVSDHRRPLAAAIVEATVEWPGGERRWRWQGDLATDACTLVGRLAFDLPSDARSGPLTMQLHLRHDDAQADASYASRVVGASKL